MSKAKEEFLSILGLISREKYQVPNSSDLDTIDPNLKESRTTRASLKVKANVQKQKGLKENQVKPKTSRAKHEKTTLIKGKKKNNTVAERKQLVKSKKVVCSKEIQQSPKNLVECPYPECKKPVTKRCLSRHMKLHSAMDHFICGICGITASNKPNLRIHYSRKHKDEPIPETFETVSKPPKCVYTKTKL